jgi:glycine oxidase
MDFVIVGGGVNGLVAALQLLQRGASVTVLERGQTGREASWAGGGILSPLCPWDYPDEVTRLALRGMARFPELAAHLHAETGIDPEYEVRGLLVLPPLDVRKAQDWCSTHDMPSQLLKAQDEIPGLQGECLLLPEVAQARNPRFLRALQQRVRQLGGKIVELCQVRAFLEEGGSVSGMETSTGIFRADHYLLTAGAWCQSLLGKHALPIALKPVRGQMLLYKFDAPPLKHIVLHDGLYLISRRDGHLLIGSTLEDVGFDARTTDAAREELKARACKLLPELTEMPLVQHWAGLRPGSPGNIPVIGRHPELANLWLNCGHFRYGVTMAPASTEILLNELQNLPQPFDAAPYRPSRQS